MKKKLFLNFLLTTFLFNFLFLNKTIAQSLSVCEKAVLITKNAEQFHYKPRPIDDDFSELVFNQIIKTLDEDALYFSKEDIENLETYRYKIDDDIKNQSCEFYSVIKSRYKKMILFTDSLLNEFDKHSFDFSKNDSILLGNNNTFVSKKKLKIRWINLLKVKILYKHFSSIENTSKVEAPTKKQIAQYRDAILNQLKCNLKSDKDEFEKYISSVYLKSISKAFDPHTEYFTPEDANSFEQSLSKEMQSFGLQIVRNDLNEIEISQLVPGSSAWSSNALNVGDVIFKIKTKTKTYTNLECISIYSLIEIFSNEAINEASFFVRKKNGKKVTISLLKKTIDVQENIIQSYILEAEQKIGYIYLPSFYTSNEFVSAENGCANDFAKELIYLKREGIDGLIIDLRDNTGGSMLEAIKLAGIFIDYGALSILDSKEEGATLLKDLNRGQIYSNSLVVLINKYSASASELFAAAIQDYRRGIIVGSSSYGKSTAQVVLPLNTNEKKLSEIDFKKESKDGFLKLTTSIFYRVTGGSHQKEGVIPDIILPSLYDDIELGEANYKTALEKSSIEKESYYKPLKEIDLKEIKNRSQGRVASNSNFKELININTKLKEFQNNYKVPLKFEYFSTFYSNMNSLSPNYDIKEKAFNVFNSKSYFDDFFEIKNLSTDLNQKVIQQIENDIQIHEAFKIIEDFNKH